MQIGSQEQGMLKTGDLICVWEKSKVSKYNILVKNVKTVLNQYGSINDTLNDVTNYQEDG